MQTRLTKPTRRSLRRSTWLMLLVICLPLIGSGCSSPSAKVIGVKPRTFPEPPLLEVDKDLWILPKREDANRPDAVAVIPFRDLVNILENRNRWIGLAEAYRKYLNRPVRKGE